MMIFFLKGDRFFVMVPDLEILEKYVKSRFVFLFFVYVTEGILYSITMVSDQGS